METAPRFAAFKVIGGSPVFDLLNTAGGWGGGPEDETLHGYPDLVAWAKRVGILDAAKADRLRRLARARPAEAHATFQRALAMRHSLIELFSAVLAGSPPPAPDLAAVGNDEAD